MGIQHTPSSEDFTDVDYSQMTDADEREYLLDILSNLPLECILEVGSVYSELREHFNNDVLDDWADANPELAYKVGHPLHPDTEEE